MTQKKWAEHVVNAEEAGSTVEQIAKDKLLVSGRMLQRLTRSKGIQLNRKAAFLKRVTKEGDIVSIRIAEGIRPTTNDTVTTLPPADHEVPLTILYEDEYFIIVNKPSKMTAHPIREDQRDTLANQLVLHWQKRNESCMPHLVHRLDRDTSGTILVAKSSYAHQLADKLLREGKIKRTYLAVLTGVLDQKAGTINAAIRRDPTHKLKREVHEKGESAITHYQVLATDEETTLVEVELETGRTHQIRVHFAHLGYPLAGDSLYGGERFGFMQQALHAYRLEFFHPVLQKQIACKASLPGRFQQYIETRFSVDINL
ncbi:RluA family pseudouridine synthase [Brevibacillus daliensis]|uniref:RluA family pseudouridine synthase n=1 Tax=Brevibacillus daliensis TaxID=2892995 RepID=UPI001E5E5170|nr:RluA family pseudouridine synthase [Brevibacillus daliensis]